MSANGNGEQIARAFHESCERQAPAHGYNAREASAVPWEQVPERDRTLMVAMVNDLLDRGVIAPAASVLEGVDGGRELTVKAEDVRVGDVVAAFGAPRRVIEVRPVPDDLAVALIFGTGANDWDGYGLGANVEVYRPASSVSEGDGPIRAAAKALAKHHGRDWDVMSQNDRAQYTDYAGVALSAAAAFSEGRREPLGLLLDVLEATGNKQAILTPALGTNRAGCELRDRPERHGQEEHTNVAAFGTSLPDAIHAAVDYYHRADAQEAGER
jgi:hypothetical protein